MTANFKNIQVNISVYFAAMIMFLCIFAPYGSAITSLLCCIAHETGHLVFIRIFGTRVKFVSFGIYGMRIETSKTLRVSHIKDAIISFAGPAVNIILALSGSLLGNSRFMYINSALAAVNLMPAGKTDGWNILYNLLIQKFDESKTQTVLTIIGTVFLGLIYISGIMILLKNGYNFSLIAVAVYITIIYLIQR